MPELRLGSMGSVRRNTSRAYTLLLSFSAGEATAEKEERVSPEKAAMDQEHVVGVTGSEPAYTSRR